jgi:methanesulfonate monooxygenase small subunit
MSRELSNLERRALAEEVIYAGVALLDDRQFDAWLEQTSRTFRYRIGAYSPEIRKEMIWLEHDREGLRALFALLGKHHVDHALWFRQAIVQRVSQDAPNSLRVVTQLAIFHTTVDVGDTHVESGSSRLFAVGRYHDQLVLEGGRWVLAERNVRLDTRQLGIGSHHIV